MDEYYIQVQFEDSGPWFEVPEEDYSQMKPFGHYTRLRRIISYPYDASSSFKRREAIAYFVKKRFKELYPVSPEIRNVRFVGVSFPVGSSIAKPQGGWVKIPLAKISPERQVVYSTHVVYDR